MTVHQAEKLWAAFTNAPMCIHLAAMISPSMRLWMDDSYEKKGIDWTKAKTIGAEFLREWADALEK